ncbi:MAG: hypothetical protein LBT04_09200 [Prevotellaceae bacterium]|nr:hypothetical protein [Prevotellaceae bacterium]
MILAFLSSILLFSCTGKIFEKSIDNNKGKYKIQSDESSQNIVEIDLDRSYREMVLGAVIKNPFSVENMQKGKELMYQYLDDLAKFGITKNYLDKFNVETTDLYVRFLPKNFEEMLILEADTNLILFEHPLHREIIEDGDYYIDADLPKDSNLIWLYAVVPHNYQLDTGVEYEIIESLFLPEHSPQFPLYYEWLHSAKDTDFSTFWYADGRTPLENDFRNALTNAAFRAAEYEEQDRTYNHSQWEKECVKKYFIFKSWSWTDCSHKIYPQGRILIEIPKNTTGLSGVKVRIWRWYRADEVYTDGAGYFYDSKAWSGEAWANDYIGYKVIMKGKRKNNNWDFKDKFVSTHSYKMGYCKLWESPHFTLTHSVSETWGRGVLSNAVYDFCLNAENTNMTLPPNNLRIASWYKSGLGSISTPLLQHGVTLGFPIGNARSFGAMWLYQFLGPIVYFCGWQPAMIVVFDDNIGNYERMITSMWHELSHASHFTCIHNNFDAQTAVNYWNYVVYYESDHGLNDADGPYGNKGDADWERIALTEGWGKFREWYLGERYLNYNCITYNTSDTISFLNSGYLPYNNNEFEYEYAGMFSELYNAHCSMQNLEKLLQLEPASRHSAINTIMFKYNL